MTAGMTAKFNPFGRAVSAAACASVPADVIMDTVLLAVSILLARLVRIMEFST